MGAVVETRTVKTRGKFVDVNRYLSSHTPTSGIFATLTGQDEHRLQDPRRLPAEHVYHTDCPHQFRLATRETTSSKGVSSSGQGKEPVVHLSESVYQTYANWTMTWEFSLNYGSSRSNLRSEVTITPYSNPVEWKTISVGSQILESMTINNYQYGYHYTNSSLDFTVTWSRQEESLNSTHREVESLRRAMAQMRTTMFDPYKLPSIDITRLIFCSKGSGAVKSLYVPSHILTQFEYFQRCHSSEYSETQHADKSQHEMNETEIPGEGFYEDDSDEEWDADSDHAEPEKNVTFKATIHVRGTARQTYQAFIDYAICGALYFAPLRSAYQKYCDTLPSSASEVEEPAENPCTPWPEWAEAHHTPHTVVPSFKTLTSPKSMYRLADMLIIPELKKICHKQIIACLEKSTVISDIQSPLFEQHQELRLSAYKKINKDWRSIPSSVLSPLIRYLSEEESVIILNYLLSVPPEESDSIELSELSEEDMMLSDASDDE